MPRTSLFMTGLAFVGSLALLLVMLFLYLASPKAPQPPTALPAIGQLTATPPVKAAAKAATLTPQAKAASRTRPGPTLNAARIAAPRLDGDLREWTGSAVKVEAVVYGADAYGGPDDLGGQVWLGWDDQNLYLAARVTDDQISQPARGAAMYQSDSLELQWDTDLQGDFDSNEFDADDWHIGLMPGIPGVGGAEAYVWSPQALTGAEAGIRVASSLALQGDQARGYQLEAAIPWRLIGVTPQGGQTFGLAVSFSDNDTPAPAQQTMLSTSPTRRWHQPTTFNTLVLQP